jgi:hypothetical protein
MLPLQAEGGHIKGRRRPSSPETMSKMVTSITETEAAAFDEAMLVKDERQKDSSGNPKCKQHRLLFQAILFSNWSWSEGRK